MWDSYELCWKRQESGHLVLKTYHFFQTTILDVRGIWFVVSWNIHLGFVQDMFLNLSMATAVCLF